MTGFPISRNPIVRQGDRRQPPHDFPGVPFSLPAAFDLRTIKVFRAKSARRRRQLRRQRRRRRARRRMRRVVGKRWSQTKGESEEIVARKNVIAIEFGRTGTQESRKSLIRCSRQRNSTLARESQGEEDGRARERGDHRVAPRLDLEGELKIVPDYERRGIDCRSVYCGGE